MGHAANRVVSVFERLLDTVFPARCVQCGTAGSWLCPSCQELVRYYQPPWAPSIQDLGFLREVRAAAMFEGPLREAIHQFKYNGLHALAPLLGQVLYRGWQSEPWPVDLIVPVPLYAQRLRARGYNQSALLARELSQRTGLPVVDGVLCRVVATPSQVGLSALEREENVSQAFRCVGTAFAGKHALLLDDVLTTGATLRACARALQQGDAGSVWGFTLAQ